MIALEPPPNPNRAEFPFTGTARWRGFTIYVENDHGSERRGVGANGVPWCVRMCAGHYGEIAGTEATDGDPIDVYLGPDVYADLAYVVRQLDPSTGKSDEPKVMLGYASPMSAREAYKTQYDQDGFYGGMWPISLAELRMWARSGDAWPAPMQEMIKGEQLGLFAKVHVKAHVAIDAKGKSHVVQAHVRTVQKRAPAEAAPAKVRHPDDTHPDQVGVLRWDMDLGEAEAAICGHQHEHLVVFASDGRQIARGGPEQTIAALKAFAKKHGDPDGTQLLRERRLASFEDAPKKMCMLDETKHAAAIADPHGVTITHNHPNGDPCLSAADIAMAFKLEAAEIRAVTVDGRVMSMKIKHEINASMDLPARRIAASRVAGRLRDADLETARAACDEMDRVIRAAGGDLADGASAKGYTAAKWREVYTRHWLEAIRDGFKGMATFEEGRWK